MPMYGDSVFFALYGARVVVYIPGARIIDIGTWPAPEVLDAGAMRIASHTSAAA
jgi:hypothetical protein